MVDMVVPRQKQKQTISTLLNMLMTSRTVKAAE
jgi:acetyl-CoA carboxylase beta subunit